MEVIRILQFSDLHLFGNGDAKFLGINVNQSFRAVLSLAKKTSSLIPPSLVLLTGDLSHDYSEASYTMVRKLCQEFSCPVKAIPGNHDDFSVFNRILGGGKIDVFTKDITVGGSRILLLNSQWPGQVAGYLGEGELLFLEHALNSKADQQTLVFLHHQVLPVGSLWLDKTALSNQQEFLSIIKRHPQVKAVVSGHVHQETSKVEDQVTFLTTPATSWQFALNSSRFKLDTAMPGYRWFDIYPDHWQTAVERVIFNQKFVPELNSKGY